LRDESNSSRFNVAFWIFFLNTKSNNVLLHALLKMSRLCHESFTEFNSTIDIPNKFLSFSRFFGFFSPSSYWFSSTIFFFFLFFLSHFLFSLLLFCLLFSLLLVSPRASVVVVLLTHNTSSSSNRSTNTHTIRFMIFNSSSYHSFLINNTKNYSISKEMINKDVFGITWIWLFSLWVV
jgi:hypothetical protein